MTDAKAFVDTNILLRAMMSAQMGIIESLFRIADETGNGTAQLLTLLKTYSTHGKQVYDANIVASMLTHGIDTLLTINVDDMKRFEPAIKLISPMEKA